MMDFQPSHLIVLLQTRISFKLKLHHPLTVPSTTPRRSLPSLSQPLELADNHESILSHSSTRQSDGFVKA